MESEKESADFLKDRCGSVNDRLVLQVSTAPKPPLCKGRWQPKADGGDVAEKCYDFASDFGEYDGSTAQPLSQKSEIFDSSPYTGEPFGRSRATATSKDKR